MANDHDNQTDSIGRRPALCADDASNSDHRKRMSCRGKSSAHGATTDTRMLSKSEITILAVTVLGTLAAWLAGPHIPLVPLPHDAPGLVCDAPASAFRSVTPLSSSL
jgi:hypothetical protein